MAENNSSQEKTEEPTPKRLRDARNKGQVPRSRELITAAVVTFGVSAGLMLGPGLARGALEFLRERLSFTRADLVAQDSMAPALGEALLAGLLWVLPFLVTGILAAFTSAVLFGGVIFSGKALAPDLSKIDPIKGLGRVFSMNGLIELVKAVAKFVMLGAMVVIALWQSADTLFGLATMDVRSAIGKGLTLCLWVLMVMCIGLALIAAIDVPVQLMTFKKKMRMTKQEVRDEMKETEGRPEVKSRIRQLQQEAAQHRMMEAVPTADVIVTNPRHFAVALCYKPATMPAPKVVAKGADELAASIRELAAVHRIPIVSSPPLARSLYRHVQINAEVPVALYTAVAQILSYVFQLKAPRSRRPAKPAVSVPEELQWQPPTDEADAATSS